VLRSYKKRPEPPPTELIEPWTEELVTLGSRIVHRRQQFLQTFSDDLSEAYRRIEAVAERPTIEYDTIADLDTEASVEDIAEAFRAALNRKSGQENDRGTTLVGPQRDELIFRLDDLKVRRYGSQGQHRTFAMALKLAQYFYLQARSDTEPLLLLDDAFGKLDADRTQVFLDLLRSDAVGQSLLTATQRAPFEDALNADPGAHRAFRVRRDEGAAAVTPVPETASAEVPLPGSPADAAVGDPSAERE
jgi:DNA replication and repair protein RecF